MGPGERFLARDADYDANCRRTPRVRARNSHALEAFLHTPADRNPKFGPRA